MSKRIRKHWGKITIATLCLMLVVGFVSLTIFWPTQKIQAALNITSATLDEWQNLQGGELAVGKALDISGSYGTIVYIEVALTDANAYDGIEIGIEISDANDQWMLMSPGFMKGTAETPAITDLDESGGATAGDTTITLTDGTTGEFDLPGRKFFILHGTVAQSESVRCKSSSTHVITLCQDLTDDHVDTELCTDRVDEWTIPIPLGVGYMRVLVNNVDAADAVHWMSRVSMADSL